MSLFAWVAFMAAAAVGAPLRYLVDTAVADRTDGGFPWGTLVVNATGSLLLGLVAGLALYHGLGDTPATIVGTGLCGAYTTFSTFSYETTRLVEQGAVGLAVRNIVGTLIVGAISAALGLALAAVL